jgi:hypothetical protein
LRELKNMIRSKGRFYYYGDYKFWNQLQTGKILVALEKDRGQWEKLAGIFDQLPPEVGARKCSVCSGPVINGVCRDCGRSFRALHRKRGLGIFLVGAAAEVLGIALTLGSESPSGTKIYIGLIIFGLMMMFLGAVGIIFGVRLLEFGKRRSA